MSISWTPESVIWVSDMIPVQEIKDLLGKYCCAFLIVVFPYMDKLVFLKIPPRHTMVWWGLRDFEHSSRN